MDAKKLLSKKYKSSSFFMTSLNEEEEEIEDVEELEHEEDELQTTDETESSTIISSNNDHSSNHITNFRKHLLSRYPQGISKRQLKRMRKLLESSAKPLHPSWLIRIVEKQKKEQLFTIWKKDKTKHLVFGQDDETLQKTHKTILSTEQTQRKQQDVVQNKHNMQTQKSTTAWTGTRVKFS